MQQPNEKVVLISKSQLMQVIESGRGRETFTDSEEGIFDVTAMREYAFKNKLPTQAFPTRGMEQYLREHRVIDNARVRELRDYSYLCDPALVVIYQRPGEAVQHLLIDGSHRIMRRCINRFSTFRAYVFTEAQIIRPDLTGRATLEEVGMDWGDKVVDGKIVKR